MRRPRIGKLTRAKVVEVLRCAADARQRGVNGMFGTGLGRVECRAWNLAWCALDATRAACGYNPDAPNYSYSADLLEAAARVEEGTWP
jgi:hypothetical protein